MFSIEKSIEKNLQNSEEIIKKEKITSISFEILGKCAGGSLVRPFCSVDDAIDGFLRNTFLSGSGDSLREEGFRVLTPWI